MGDNIYNSKVRVFRFVVMGDSRGSCLGSNEKILRALLDNIKQLPVQPEFIGFLGDMVDGEDKFEQELNKWKDLVSEYYPIDMYYLMVGNHETSEVVFNRVFSHLPDNQVIGYGRTVYYFDYGNSRFIVLNANRKNQKKHYVVGQNQLIWLENILRNSRKTHNFVMFHEPAFPTGHHYGESLDAEPIERNKLWSILDKYKVRAVFMSHEHNYSRRLIDGVLNNRGYEFKNRIYHIISGGSGGPTEKVVLNNKNLIVGPVPVYHYITVDIIDKLVIFNAYDVNNKCIDSFMIDNFNNDMPISSIKEVLISTRDEWRYSHDGSEQNENWTNIEFDDSSWFIGYGDVKETTVINYDANEKDKYITNYFRKTININNHSQYAGLILKILRDDGAVVYLNGEEILRINMPLEEIENRTLPNTPVDGLEEPKYYEFEVNPELLNEGQNIIAVKVHKVNSYGKDLSFDLELVAYKKISFSKVLKQSVNNKIINYIKENESIRYDTLKKIVNLPSFQVNAILGEMIDKQILDYDKKNGKMYFMLKARTMQSNKYISKIKKDDV